MCGALILMMIIADETDAAAMAKWEHYKAGTDLEALAWRDAQAEDDPNKDPFAQPNNRHTLGTDSCRPTRAFSSAPMRRVARMLDELADGSRGARRHADVRRFRDRHGAVRHAHPTADGKPQQDWESRIGSFAETPTKAELL